ncbi:MAG: polysaccharide deacetylase, partial [Myxococcales bacterium]|nr:polysaccharide deacetylase [Myxococcales bacterium]
LDDPRVLRAPADPYRVGTPYWERGGGLPELPIGVTRDGTGRLPFIGTSVVLAGSFGAAALAKLMVGRPFVNLELHGIDLADAEMDGLQFLAKHQPDLRRSLAQKTEALRATVQELRFQGYRFVTLAEAAEAFCASSPAG